MHPHISPHGRDERDEQGHGREALNVEPANDVGAGQSSKQPDEQPGQARTGHGPQGVVAFDLVAQTARQLVVPFGLFFHEVHHIVNGDAAQQAIVVVHHGQGHEVVLLHDLHHLFVRFIHLDGAGVVFLEQVANGAPRTGCGEQEAFQGQASDELPCSVDHVDAVEGLDILGLFPHFSDGLRDGPIEFDADELGAHQCAGGAFRVAEQRQQVFSVLRVQLGDDLGGPLLGQSSDDVRGIVRVDVLQDFFGDLPGGQGGQQALPNVFLQLHEHVAPSFDFDEFPEVLDLLFFEAVKDFRDVGRVEIGQMRPQAVVLTAGDAPFEGVQEIARDVLHGTKLGGARTFFPPGGEER